VILTKGSLEEREQMDTSVLKAVPLFKDIDAEDLEALGQLMSETTLKRGDSLFREGDDGDRLYIVTDGKVKLSHSSDDGRENLIAVLGPGEIIGELSLFDLGARSSPRGGHPPLITGLIGYKKVKAQMPFAPKSAVFGLLFDLGVLREGSAMTASRLKKEQAERAARKQAEREAAAEQARQEAEERKARGEVEPQPLTEEQLRQRTKERREHLAALRDDMQKYSEGVQANAQGIIGSAKAKAQQAPTEAVNVGRGLAENITQPNVVKARWKSFAALGAALPAALVFLRRFLRR